MRSFCPETAYRVWPACMVWHPTNCPAGFYNTVYQHRAPGYLAPREYITRSTSDKLSGN